MWSKSYSRMVEGIKAESIWKVWADVNQWHTWQKDIEYAKLDGEFEAGRVLRFKPKGGPNFKIELIEVNPNAGFVDLTRFPLARMYDSHELIEHGDKLEIKNTIRVEGLLSFLWRKLVAQGVAGGMPEETERLIEKARNA